MRNSELVFISVTIKDWRVKVGRRECHQQPGIGNITWIRREVGWSPSEVSNPQVSEEPQFGYHGDTASFQ